MIAPVRSSRLFAPSARPKASRSAAQMAASRRNGKLSRGPKTLAGKAKSRLNSLKHGLLAKTITPRADGRGEDQTYLRVRRQLLHDLRPRGAADYLVLDALAADFVQLGRVKQLQDILMRPSGVDPHVRLSEGERRLRSDLRWIEKVANWCRTGQRLTCPPKAAARLAEILAGVVRQFQQEWREAKAEGDPLKGDKDWRGWAKMMQQVRPEALALNDQQATVALLTGARELSSDARRRLGTLLAALQGHLHTRLVGVEAKERQYDVALLRHLAALAHSPDGLQVLARYEGSIWRRIESRLNLLRSAR